MHKYDLRWMWNCVIGYLKVRFALPFKSSLPRQRRFLSLPELKWKEATGKFDQYQNLYKDSMYLKILYCKEAKEI